MSDRCADVGRRATLAALGACTLMATTTNTGAKTSTGAKTNTDAKVSTPAMITRPIPSSGEALPAIGCGTWLGFDHAPGSATWKRLPGVLDALFDAGGRLIDSSPMYGRAEQSTGELLADRASKGADAFIATKVWTRGRAEGVRQMQTSMSLLGRAAGASGVPRSGGAPALDLMQIHNLVDWREHLATLRDWKSAGRIRYIGITHYTASAYRDLAAVLRAESLDFLQLNYSIDAREAERELLPLAAERGTAVLVNRPFGGGGLIRRLNGQPLPGWAAEAGASSWAQLLLRFVLSNPAVTCAIPGTSRPEHMADNAAAAFTAPPPPAFWADKIASLPI